MSTEDRAATCIQAGFRGFQWRKNQRRGIRAVIKLQALQRGRFTRREFVELRDFSREQESFQQATRRRQNRIWRNEQELYFLQHTNAADLERVRAFQRQHSARVIQRAWCPTNQSTAPRKEVKTAILDPNDRIYLFDPFGLVHAESKAQSARFDHWSRDKQHAKASQLSPSLLLNKDEIRASASTLKPPSATVDDESFATRRKVIQERIKRLAAQEKAKSESVKMPKTPVDNNATEGSKPQVNRRRELYEKVMAMKYTTAQRVRRYERGARASRPDRELLSTQLIVSCENRLKHLQAETTEDMTPSEEDNQQDHDMEKWDPARRVRAWNHHRRAVCSVLDKRHWWQTQLAGEQRDIRRVIVAKSPWEDENKIWIWPRDESSNQEASGATDRVCNPSSVSPWPSMEIHTFLVGGNGSKEQQSQSVKPLNDDEASDWWRAHCTQSHLATNGALLIQNPYSAEFSNNVTNEGDIYPVCTSEVVANRDLYELQRRAKSAARTKSLERDVEQRMKALTAQVERRVHEMEVQVEANTQLALENVRRKEEQRARISREQLAAMTLQRHARGMQGRQCARERRAEFFVMVRGRAIRRGRCEECGDERAVLECQQCEESVHFCPLCWVHVHSTRRRKTHVAMPMATVVALAPVQENKSAKPQILETVTKVEENAAPRLRPLPMPHKQSFTRSAERAPAELKGSLIDTNKRNAMVSKEDAVRNTTTTEATDVRKSTTPELAEACALARRVRAKVGHSTDKTGVVPVRRCDAVAATESGPDFPAQESSEDNNEIDFSSMDGDGAAMIESEVPLEEQQIPIESTEGVEAPVEAVQPIEPEPVKLSSEPCSLHATEEKLHADELLPDTSISVAAHASTTNSEQQEAEAIEVVPDNRPSLESNKSPGGDQCVGSTTEALFTEVTGPGNGPAIFEAAAEADTIPSVERPTSTQPSEAQGIPVTAVQVNDVSSTDAGAAHDDMPPSEGSTGEVDHNQAVEEAVTET